MGKTYATYDVFPNISDNIVSNLINNSDAELIWKLLKYSTNDDWESDDLTKAEKRELIYDGSADATKYAIFYDSGMDDVINGEGIYLRIYPYYTTPDTPYHGIVDIAFEIICHYSINTLSNYTTRADSIIAKLLKCLNGTDIGGLGEMYFNASRAKGDKIQNFNQPPFKGKVLLMSVNLG